MSARAPILGALALLVACTTVHPPVPPSAPANAGFSHEDFDAFLLRFVNDRGRVDYTAALANRADLDRYLAQLAAVSPDSHPQRFPGEHDRLAYWLNAYNASAISILLAHYPISSVNDVRPPRVFFFLPGRAGFFLFRRVVLGGKRTTLYSLENGLVRKRFLEPRVHFALNCAAKSCPRLPARAFTGPDLEAQLERETRRFVAEDRNVRFDPARPRSTSRPSSSGTRRTSRDGWPSGAPEPSARCAATSSSICPRRRRRRSGTAPTARSSSCATTGV